MCESDNKCFTIRDGTIDYGKDYEMLVAAYYAVKFALDDSVVDFLLSTNNNDFGDFDDVVVELELPNQVSCVYALQLKHSFRPKSISFASMSGGSGNFSLKRYSNDFLKIKANNPNNFDNFHFVLYTNSFLPALVQRCGQEEIRVDEMLMPNSQITVTKSIEAMTRNDAKCLFDTSNGESSMYRFQGGEIDPEFSEKFALFTNQMHATDVETKIREVLMDLCADNNVVTNLLMYFKYWCRGDYGCYKLSKYDVRVKLAELILNPYILDFPLGIKMNVRAKLFEDAVKCFDITVIENINVGIISDAAVEDSDLLTKFGLLQNQSLLKSWYLNLIPLAVRYNDTVRKAMELCNYEGKRKKFLLNSSNHGLSKDWKVFNTLGDVPKDLYDRVAENFEILLQDRHIVSIKDLLALDDSLDITATELLRMVDAPLLVGELKSRLPEYYVSRTVHKVFLNRDVVHCDGLFVIEGSDIATLRKHIKSETVVHIDEYLFLTGVRVLRPSSHYLERPSSHYLEQGNLPKKLIIFCNDQAKFDKLISGSSENVIHHLRFTDQSRLEWIWSKGKVNELVPYRINENEHSVSANEIFSYFTNNLNILCADPGMGKSVMLDFLEVNTPESYWSIKIDLNEHFKLSKNDVDTDLFAYFLAVTNNFDKKVAQSFAKAGRVVVLWDGFDELPEDAGQAVVEIVGKFRKHGFRQLIACRFYNSVMLQDAFDTCALTLTHFRDVDLKNYGNQKLKDKCDPEEFELVLQKMYENIAMFGFDAGVPLQAYMLTEVFCGNPGEFLRGKIVTVTNIYRSFIESKFDHYFKKEKAANTNPKHRKTFKMLRLKLYEIAALEACLDRIDFNELKLDCTELLDDLKSEDDPVGLIVRVLKVKGKGMAVFAHRTYAEFLAASWLSRNLQHIQMLFKEKLNGVRLMFDVILAKDSGAHLAVLYKNPQLLCKCEDFTCKDAGGRSPLHIAASWGMTRQFIKPSMPGYFISNTAAEEDSKHLEILECLLEHNDPFAADSIHQWDSINYADKSLSLSSLEVILRKFDCNINKLTHCDELTLCYYSIKFNYETLFSPRSRIGTVPNATFVDGTNLLFLAVQNNALRFMPKLLEIYDVNAIDSIGETALLVAVRRGYHEMVLVLLENGARVDGAKMPADLSGDGGYTLLHAAVYYGHAEVCEILLKLENVDIDARTQTGWTSIILAAQEGHLDVVKLLIGKGAKLNGNDQGYTPLHQAAFRGHAEVCEYLLKLKDVDIDAQTQNGWTSVIMAAQENHLDMVEFLIGKGAKLNGNNQGYTPLHQAATFGHAEVCEILLKLENVDIDARAGNGWTSIIFAAQKGHLDVVKLLIGKGAKLDGDDKGYTPLYQAALGGHAEVCEILLKLENVDIDARAQNGVTPLIAAAGEGHSDVVKLLIGKGAKLDGDDEGYTPLHQAATFGQAEVCEILLKLENVDIDARAKNGVTPLIAAAQKGHSDVVKLLIDKGAKLSSNNQGYTPLHQAASRGHAEVCEILLKLEDVDIDARTQNGWTSIILATQKGHLDVIELLIGKGAKLDGNEEGYTPLHQAATSGHAEVCEILLKLENVDINARAQNGWTPIISAAQEGHLDVVKLLIGEGAKLDGNDEGYTPLHQAATFGHAEVCENLLKLENVDIDARAGNGWTSIIFAAQEGHLDVVKLLIGKGARLDGDDKGYTPLHQAATSGHAEVCEIFLKLENVDIDARAQNGVTPLMTAVKEGHLDVIKLLIGKGAQLDGDDGGYTPLHRAASNGHAEVCEILLKLENVDIDARTQSGVTPILEAAGSGHSDVIELLIGKGAKLSSNNQGYTPLHQAAFRGHAEVCETLLKLENVDIDARAGNGWTSIIFAAQEGHLDVVKLLIGKGAKLDGDDIGYTPLHQAATSGHAEVCGILLKLENVDIDARAQNGVTPLIAAAGEGHLDVVKLLIDKGAKLNGNNQGYTPLHHAASYGHAEVCEILLKLENVDVDARTQNGATPIIGAAERGHSDVIELLIGNGAKLYGDDQGFTPLHEAASYGHAKVCEILLELENVDINAPAENGSTPIIVADREGHLDVVKLLIDKGAKLDGDDEGYTPLHQAATSRHAEVCEIFLKLENVDINARTQNDWTSIILAAQEGHLDVVKLLIGKGAKLNGNNQGYTPLHQAAFRGHAEVCEIFLKLENVDIDARTQNGVTSIMLAAQEGHLDVVNLLIGKGAKLNGNIQGYTPLHQAASYGHAEVCEILLKLEDVDIDARAQNGWTSIILAAQEGHLDVMRLLIGKGAKLNGNNQGYTPLHQAASYGHAEVCEILLKSENVDIDARAQYGMTPIILAAAGGHSDVTELLIGKGAKLDGDDEGYTPLHRAAFNGHAEVCEILLKLKNVDIDARTQNGVTPLRVAAREGHLNVVRLLVSKGAEVDSEDNHGNTALFGAAAENHVDVVQFLHQNGARIHVVDQDGDTPLHDAAANGMLDSARYLIESRAILTIANLDGKTPLDLAIENGRREIVELLGPLVLSLN